MDWLIRALWPLRFRGKKRLLSRLVPKAGIRTAHVFGVPVELDLADVIQREMYLGCFEPHETRVVSRLLRPGMTFVDAGANAGWFTFLAASRVGPTGRVLAVEPDPVLAEKLRVAVRPHIKVFGCALGRAAGTLTLSIPPPGNRSPTLAPVAGWESVAVPVRTLDELLDVERVGTVDLLKLDVEGAEAEILAGAARTLPHVRAVLCEFNTYWLGQLGTSPEALWRTLLGAGFRPAAPKPTFGPGSVETVFLVR